jgi:hypothetical protein
MALRRRDSCHFPARISLCDSAGRIHSAQRGCCIRAHRSACQGRNLAVVSAPAPASRGFGHLGRPQCGRHSRANCDHPNLVSLFGPQNVVRELRLEGVRARRSLLSRISSLTGRNHTGEPAPAKVERIPVQDAEIRLDRFNLRKLEFDAELTSEGTSGSLASSWMGASAGEPQAERKRIRHGNPRHRLEIRCGPAADADQPQSRRNARQRRVDVSRNRSTVLCGPGKRQTFSGGGARDGQSRANSIFMKWKSKQLSPCSPVMP